MADEWIEYDPDHKLAHPLPQALNGWSGLAWVYDEFYDGVTLARWTQNGDDPSTGWWVGINHGDDIGVTHWKPLRLPAAPAGRESVIG